MHIPPQPGPGWRFNPPPGWPTPPEGWTPGATWSGPEEDWPAAPPYWDWWVQDSTSAAPSRRRLLLLGAAAVAAVAVVALVLSQLTEPSQDPTTVTQAAASDTETGLDAEPAVNPGPEDGGTYRDAREIMTKLEQAYGRTCDYVSYNHLNVNGRDMGDDTYALCQLGLDYAKIHVFSMPVDSFAWQTVFGASMHGNYVVLYGQNWIINATGADQFGLAAHRVLGGHTKVAR